MTRRPQRHAVAVAGAALLAALAGCSSDSEAAPPVVQTISPSATPSSTPSPTPTKTAPATAQEQAAIAAQQAVRKYYSVMDALGTDPAADMEPLKSVTVSTGLAEANNEVWSDRSQQFRQIGTTRVVGLTVRSVDLTLKATKQPPVIPVVEVEACYDVSAVNVVDAAGRSVITAERLDQGLQEFRVVNYDYPDPAGWKVGYTAAKGKACVGGV